MPSPRTCALVGALLALAAAGTTACSPPPDHPELAVQQTEQRSLVLHLDDCSDPQVDEIRVISDWGEVEEELAVFGPEELAAVDDELGPTAVAEVPRRAWAPRLRIEVEGDEPFEVTFDPDDVPPVDWQWLVPDAPNKGEIVDVEDFEDRCG